MPSFAQLRALTPSLPDRVVETATKRRIGAAFAHAIDKRTAVAVTGAPGVGKTTALAAIAQARPATAFLTITPSNRRLKAVLSMLCDAFRIWTDAKFASDLASVLEYNLPLAAAEGRWVLIVDEVQLLDGDAVFQLVKYNDLFQIPMVLAGNDHALKRTRVNASAIDQVRDRIGQWVAIDGVSEADLIDFCIDWNVEGKDARALVVRHGLGSSLRETTRLLAEARVFAGDRGPIRRADLAEALTLIHGPAKAGAVVNDRAT